MFFLVAFFINFQVFWMRFFSIWSGLNLQKACFSLRKSMVFNKSEVSQKYGFHPHFWRPKVDPGLENVVKRPCFFICFFMFFYMKNLIFWWYTWNILEVRVFRLFRFFMFFQCVCWMALFYAFWRIFGRSGVSCRSQNRLRPLRIINFMVGLLTFSKKHIFSRKNRFPENACFL